MKLMIQKTERSLPTPDVANISELLFADANEDTDAGEAIGEIRASQNEEDYRVEIFLPGFTKNDISVELLTDGIVLVKADANAEFSDESILNPETIFSENVFACTLRLPEDVDVLETEAWYDDGVLVILAPKLAEEDWD